MKKFGYFLVLLIILSACTSGVDQKPAGDLSASISETHQKVVGNLSGSPSEASDAGQVTAANPSDPSFGVAKELAGDVSLPDFLSSPAEGATTDPLAISQSGTAVLQAGEALTPFQRQLEQAINQRKTAGLPVPSSVKFEYQATSNDAAQRITSAAAAPVGPVKIISTTVIVFDDPEQAGHNKWPSLIVKDNLPPNAQGSVLEGDYTDTYRKFMEEKVPGIWDRYEFGHEPRTHTIVETIEFTYPKERLLAPDAQAIAQAETTEQLLMGFTYTGPHLDYSIGDSLVVLGFTVYEFKAGFDLDWALGLRLPGQADLTGPNQLVQGSPYILSSAMTPLDWSAANYSNTGVAPEAGNEFVLRLNFFLGVKAVIAEVNVCPSCSIEANVDESQSFTTPFGSGASFPIPSVNIPVYNWDLGFASFGVGLEVDPNLGSDKITTNWQASGDASGSGLITYSTPGTPVSLGTVNACNLGPDNLAQIQLTDFRYWFNQFLIVLNATLKFDLFGTGVWDGSMSIASFDLSPLTGDLYLGGHTQCDWDFTCSRVGPDNIINLSIPVVDLTPPSTIITPSGTAGNNGWFVSDVQVSLSSIDLPDGCGVGVKQIEYSFDGTNWNIYTEPITISNEGTNTVYYHSIDNEGNVEPVNSQAVKIDKTPPTITGAPTTPPNAYGWYNIDVVVHFVASDAVSGIDTVTPDQILSGEGGNQSVTGMAVDMAGLSASFTVTGINIDKTQPTLSITSPEARIYENTESFNVTWSATDSLSGMASESGTLDGVPVTNGQLIELLIFGPGLHTMAVEVKDKADNIASATVVFSVSVDSRGLLAALEYMCNLGWINKHGICNSLAAKLNAAIDSIDRGNLNAAENKLNAFINELEAQKDKSINQQGYEVLKAGALYVIEHLQ